MFSLPRSNAPVIYEVRSSSVWKRSVQKNPWSSIPARRWLAACRELASALVRCVKSLPVHTQMHGGQSGHFNLFVWHPPLKEVFKKNPERVVRLHGRNHPGMLWQSHAGQRDGCSHVIRSTVGLCNWCVCSLKCIMHSHCPISTARPVWTLGRGGFVYTLEIVARILSDGVNRDRLCDTNAYQCL